MGSQFWLRTIGYLIEFAALFMLFFVSQPNSGVRYTAYVLFAIGFAFILAAHLPWQRGGQARRESEIIDENKRQASPSIVERTDD